MNEPIVDALPDSPSPALRLTDSGSLLDNNARRWRIRILCEIQPAGRFAQEPTGEKRLTCYQLKDKTLLLQRYDQLANRIRQSLEALPICSCGQCHEENQ